MQASSTQCRQAPFADFVLADAIFARDRRSAQNQADHFSVDRTAMFLLTSILGVSVAVAMLFLWLLRTYTVNVVWFARSLTQLYCFDFFWDRISIFLVPSFFAAVGLWTLVTGDLGAGLVLLASALLYVLFVYLSRDRLDFAIRMLRISCDIINTRSALIWTSFFGLVLQVCSACRCASSRAESLVV